MDFLLAAGVTALVALSVSAFSATRAFLRTSDRPEPVSDPDGLAALWKSLEGLEKRTLDSLVELKLAVADGIMRVDRADKRIQKTVTSARRQLREAGLEHAGIEAEYEELHDGDDSGVEEQVPETVERDGPSGFPGISQAQLAEMRGNAHV